MRTIIVGASGFVGSAVARLLKSEGHEVAGLARSAEAADALRALDYVAESGGFDDLSALAITLNRYDAVMFAPTIPFEMEAATLAVLMKPFEGSGRPFIFTSGTGVLSIEAHDGRWHEESFAEDEPFTPPPWIATRVDTENMVRAQAQRGIRAMVIRPPLIWGHGGSKQIPAIFESIEKTGAACYLGLGLNLYSNVHVDDLAEVYRLAIEKGEAGALYHAVAGEANFRALAEAAAQAMGCAARSVKFEEACEIWGPRLGPLFFGVSSRSRATRTRRDLGWEPRHLDVVEDVRAGSYRERYRR